MNQAHFESRLPLILDLGFRPEAVAALRQYIELLWDSNIELNLFSRQMKFEELIDNHLIDCLLALKFLPKDLKKAGDFGAGGGLPGVLYALQFPETKYVLFEKSKMKQAFLQKAKALAPNLEVQGDIPLKLMGFELISARAFKPLDVLLELSRDYYKSGGSYFLLKGRREKIDEEISTSRKKFKDLEARIEVLNSPLMQVERHLVLLGPVSK
jgi:16S rRNA (guanine527-N7)-methyltransferase